jgi:MFS transporter, PAT family, beta-lactamase induction signal transducer AmpG
LASKPKLLKTKLFWIGILYFAQGLPFGIFYDVIPVYFRQQGVDLREIGLLALVGLAWTIKFLWAPAVDHYRHHRRWMFAVDLAMGGCLVYLSMQAGFGPPVWFAIGLFTLLSATNDIAIDGYTIEMLERHELGLANGVRIGMARVGILASGVILILSDYLKWPGAFLVAAVMLAGLGVVCLLAPKEGAYGVRKPLTLAAELKGILRHPRAVGTVLMFLLATVWLVDNATHWSAQIANFWWYPLGLAGALFLLSLTLDARAAAAKQTGHNALTEGPMFGALMEMLQRRYILPVIAFVLIFKLGDASMGFMVKPFWVDSGFSATQIGLVSVNIGLVLSIAGGITGGWFTDRVGIFTALWILGLTQAVSNLGYVWAASVIPAAATGLPLQFEHQMLMYGASALESFTGGLGTAAFLAFLMAIVNKEHSATEYAILSSIFALSRQLAGYGSGFGAHYMGYAPYFLLTFFLAFPAYALLPWVKKMLNHADRHTT